MQNLTTIGYKTPLIKTVYILMTLVFLISLNMMLFGLGPSIRLRIGMTIVWGLLAWYRWRSLTHIRYQWIDKDIIITIPNQKTVTIKKADIITQKAHTQTYQRRRMVGMKKQANLIYCTTSNQHLREIQTKKGDVFIISPRKTPTK